MIDFVLINGDIIRYESFEELLGMDYDSSLTFTELSLLFLEKIALNSFHILKNSEDVLRAIPTSSILSIDFIEK